MNDQIIVAALEMLEQDPNFKEFYQKPEEEKIAWIAKKTEEIYNELKQKHPNAKRIILTCREYWLNAPGAIKTETKNKFKETMTSLSQKLENLVFISGGTLVKKDIVEDLPKTLDKANKSYQENKWIIQKEEEVCKISAFEANSKTVKNINTRKPVARVKNSSIAFFDSEIKVHDKTAPFNELEYEKGSQVFFLPESGKKNCFISIPLDKNGEKKFVIGIEICREHLIELIAKKSKEDGISVDLQILLSATCVPYESAIIAKNGLVHVDSIFPASYISTNSNTDVDVHFYRCEIFSERINVESKEKSNFPILYSLVKFIHNEKVAYYEKFADENFEIESLEEFLQSYDALDPTIHDSIKEDVNQRMGRLKSALFPTPEQKFMIEFLQRFLQFHEEKLKQNAAKTSPDFSK